MVLSFMINFVELLAQNKFNYQWITGAVNSNIVSFNNNVFDFDKFYDTSSVDGRYYFAWGSNICDSNGNLILLSNGFNVLDKNKQYIDGLDSIGGREMIKYYKFSLATQSSLFLPFSNDIYYFVNQSASDSEFYNWFNVLGHDAVHDELLYCKIDMKGNGGLGKCLNREVKLLEHETLSKTQMMACKHANGKDWWLFKQARGPNKVFKFLFTQDSVVNYGIQNFPEPTFSIWDGAGQSMFSQDGTKYATTCGGTEKIFLADFDRCTGMLSNPVILNLPALKTHNPFDSTELDKSPRGLAFSPNSRFLFISMFFNIQQLDLLDSDSNTRWSVVAELDTTWDAYNLHTNLFLGPDNKLYVGNWGGLSAQMSYFNNPDEKGLASNFCPRCLRFPKPGVTAPPNMPNYNLGASQPCWPLSTSDIKEQAEIIFYPNPVKNIATIRHSFKGAVELRIEIYDNAGRKVKVIMCKDCNTQTSIDLSGFSNGLYSYKVIQNNSFVKVGKFDIIK